MSTKDKPLSRLDAVSQPSPPAPSVDRVRFNPYTGAILKTDQPTFGKYNVFVSAGPKVVSSHVKFKLRGKSGVYDIQIPMPEIMLNVRNPNFEIIDASLYLAIDEAQFDDIDEENDIGRITGKYVVQKIGVNDAPILSNKTTMSLNALFVTLFEKYTIQDFLEKLTGEVVSNDIILNDAISLVYSNLQNLNIYAEAAFQNTLENETESFFLRNKIVSNVTFDPRYLDNPSITGFRLTFAGSIIKVNLDYKSLKTVTLGVYAGEQEDFAIDETSFVYQKSFDATSKKINNKMVNQASLMEIATSSLPVPAFNSPTTLLTNTQLNTIINSRKYVAVRVISVVTTANYTITNPGTFFKINLTSRLALPRSAPRPNHATPNTTASPYVLNLINNQRELYIYYNTLGSSLDVANTVMPSNINGIVIKYINNPNTNSNITRFYPLSSLTKINGQYNASTKVVTHYFRLNDAFKLAASTQNTYKVGVNYAQTIAVYTVDNYYQISSVPLTFTEDNNSLYKFNLTDYLSNALTVKDHILTFNKGFIVGKDKVPLSFKLEVAISPTKIFDYATQASNLVFSDFKIGTTTPTFRILHTHDISSITKDTDSFAVLADDKNAALQSGLISTTNYKTSNTTYVFRAVLLTNLSENLPYVYITDETRNRRRLGIFVKSISDKGVILGS